MTTRLSVDIGGTFTDVVLDQPSGYTTTKVLTTYADPAAGVMSGISEVLGLAGVDARAVDTVLHGTTLATNALIERRGASTGMLTTLGHRDVIEMAFENRFEQYDVNIDRAEPLVPRHLRIGVAGRMAADGHVIAELDLDAARLAVDQFVASGVESIAVCLLHSYANSEHEQALGELITAHHPGIAVSLSSKVCPEIREYERFSTTVANAYVKPLMGAYLSSLAAQMVKFGIGADVLLMTSGGGLTTLAAAAEYPIRLVESGPAGGAMLAAQLARDLEFDEVLSFDMGGTTAKICLIDQGEPLYSRAFEVDRRYRFKKGSGLPIRIPVVEMVEIGAGGGSIASLDELTRLHVGPASAGSEPGPACYGRGGTAPTVTDADVVLGKLSAAHFAGGKFSLDTAAAARALNEHLAAIDADSRAQAYAVNEIVEENMASAARAHAAEWGRGLSQRCMLAFGGAAPLHAAGLAQKLKIDRVLVPQGAGVGSAIGFLLAPIRFEVVRSFVINLQDLEPSGVAQLFDEMRAEAEQVLESANAPTPWVEQIHAYMRYAGQGYEIAVPAERSLSALHESFEQEYQRLYGRVIPGMAVELLSWTLALSSPGNTSMHGAEGVGEITPAANVIGSQAYFDAAGETAVEIVERPKNQLPRVLEGPAIVVEDQTTTVVPRGWQCRSLPSGALLLEVMPNAN